MIIDTTENRWGMVPVSREEHTVNLSDGLAFLVLYEGFKVLEKIPSDVYVPSNAKMGDVVGSARANKATIALIKRCAETVHPRMIYGDKLWTALLIEDSSLADNIVVLATQDMEISDISCGCSDCGP